MALSLQRIHPAQLCLMASILLALVLADDHHGHGGGGEADEDTLDLSQYNHHARWDSFHWLLSLTFMLILPSLSAVFAFAHRSILSTNLHVISTVYAVFEALILRFNDPNGHENRTSRGTAWFLLLLLGATTFFGLSLSGSKFLPQRFRNNPISQRGEVIVARVYKTLAVLTVITGWVKQCLAVVALLGFCYIDSQNNHTGQCLAHGIMGTAFVLYGFVLLLVLIIPWLRNNKTRYPQEFWDSVVITVWGFVNTFTEHRPWEPWSHGDYQHTAMGIIWWCMGLVGIYLSKDGHRSLIPGLVIAITGWAMSVHVQHLEISTKVHAFFGLALMFGGFSRIIEVVFVLKDQRFVPGKILSFQYLAPFCLVESGILFMGANEEQLRLVKSMGADHSSYIMVLTSAAFCIILWLVLLLELYLKLIGVDKYSGGDAAVVNRDQYATLESNPAELSGDGEIATPSPHAEDFELESL